MQRQLLGGSDVRKLRKSRSCSTFERGGCHQDVVWVRPSWDKVVDMPVVTTVGLRTVKVPQIKLIAGVFGHSCCATEMGTQLSAVAVMSAMKGFSAF